VTKKTNAPSNNIANVPHLNVSALTTKPTRLKGKNVVHQWSNNIMCTQSHAYPLWRSMLRRASTRYVDFNSITQKPPFHTKFHAKFFQPFFQPFQLHVIFSNFHKYLVDRFECKQIATPQTTRPKRTTITYKASLS